MQCNIDARGKRFRLIAGVALAAAGLGMVAANAARYIGIGLLAVGAFAILESWAGWCAVRAMGFKTRV
jgi:hypothetical protein